MAEPKFKIGQVVRYAHGSTALLRITSLNPVHGGGGSLWRYYGQQCMGGSAGAYEYDCQPASAEDMATWNRLNAPFPDDVYFMSGTRKKPRHRHNWQPRFSLTDGKYVGMVCMNGCGKEYKPPSQAQTEARRKNFHKMSVLGNLARAKANVGWALGIDRDLTIQIQASINHLIERARKEL